MSYIYTRDPVTNELGEVGRDVSLPVAISNTELPPVAGRTVTRLVKVPGIGAAAAYQAADAFGTLITFRDVFRPEKMSGVIVSAFFLDLDDEGIGKDIPIYVQPITVTADNSAAALSDADLLLCRGCISIVSFTNLANNQIGTAMSVNLWVNGQDCNLYTQLVTQGADNIAAGMDPWIGLVVIPD